MKKYLLISSILFKTVFPNDSSPKIDSLKNELDNADTYFKKCEIYLDIGILHHDLSNYNIALENYKKILLYENRLISDSEKNYLLYATYNSIAQVYQAWGDKKKANIYYNKCDDYCNEQNNLLTSTCSSIILASSLIRSEPTSGNLPARYSEVISNLDEIIKSEHEKQNHKGLSAALLTKSHILLENSYLDTTVDYEDLIKQIKRAIIICDKMQNIYNKGSNEFRTNPFIKYLAYGYSLLGFTYDNKNEFLKSIKYYRKAIEVRKNFKDNDLTGLQDDYSSLAQAYYYRDDYENALFYANESISLIEPLLETTDELKIQYYARLVKPYYLIINIYFEKGDYENGFQAIQKAKSKNLSRKIGITNDEMPSLSEIRRSIAPTEAYIVYSKIKVNPEKFMCMIITSDNIKYNKIEILDYIEMDLQNLIDKYLIQISNPFLDNWLYKDLSRKLYSILIKPFENDLEHKKDIKLFLDGILSYVPVETLIDSSGSFFIEKYDDISYFPSVSIKHKIDKRNYNFSEIKIIAFGNPIYDSKKIINKDIVLDSNSTTMNNIRSSVNKSDDLSGYYIQQGYNPQSLPYTREEIKGVISLFPNNSTFYQQKSFTEDKLKELSRDNLLLGFNIIHFATHGIIFTKFSDLNGLVLSQFDDYLLKEDGFLTKHEISKLNIKCDLTILSCCEAAKGNIYDGEGVVNLSHSFFIAGSNAVIATLWNINDESTSKFMYGLYNYFKMQKDYSKSLVDVKRDFIRGKYDQHYNHPSFWAPFIYYGK